MSGARVSVLPYDEAWSHAFEEIRTELESAIADLVLDIEHIGSTAVKGLSAKPCIDIDRYIEYKSPYIAELYRQCGLLPSKKAHTDAIN